MLQHSSLIQFAHVLQHFEHKNKLCFLSSIILNIEDDVKMKSRPGEALENAYPSFASIGIDLRCVGFRVH